MITRSHRLPSPILNRMKLSETQISKRTSQFATDDATERALISAIAQQFACGYNETLSASDLSHVTEAATARCDDFLTPFYVEGASMAVAAARTLQPARNQQDHQQLLDELPEHKYLVFAGWGWWHAILPAGVTALTLKRVLKQDPVFSSIAIDGLAFASCFLKSKAPHFSIRCPFRERRRRMVWAQGFGRALWFVSGDRSEAIRVQSARLEPSLGAELHAGIGLASGFAGIRDLDSLPNPLASDETEARAFYQGLAFGLTARRESAPASYQQFLHRLSGAEVQWVSEVTDWCLVTPPQDHVDAVANYTAWQSELRRNISMPAVRM